ncbi:MAG: hypothetical protein IJ071_00130 [Ruminococcus sp.]|nr:hypothetical protein [Ruminococcus sp.]
MPFCKFCGNKLEDGELCTCEEAVAEAKKAAEEVKETAENAVDAAKDTVENAVESAKDAAENAVESVKDTVENAADAAKDTVENAADAAKDAAENVKEALENDAPEPAIVGIPDSAKDFGKPAEAPKPEAPAYSGSMSHTGDAAAEAAPDGSAFKKGIALVGAAIVILILLIALLASLFGGGYKTPLKKAVKGINKADSQLIMEAVFTDDQIDELKDEAEDADEDYDDIIDQFDDLLDDATEVLEDEYFGKHLKVTYKITDKEKASKKELRTLKKQYKGSDQEVKKAYKLKVELTVKGKDEEETSKFDVYSVKLDDGWVLYMDEDDLTVIGEDFADAFEACGRKLTKLISKADIFGFDAYDFDF